MRIGRIARKLSAMFIRATILNAVLLSVLVAEVVGAAVKLAGG
jgi:glycerol-3-phosphate O-acyltransferase